MILRKITRVSPAKEQSRDQQAIQPSTVGIKPVVSLREKPQTRWKTRVCATNLLPSSFALVRLHGIGRAAILARS